VILRLTANVTDGKPYLLNGSRPLFPIGVPLIYSLLERAGIAGSFAFGLLNLACMCIAAHATWVICRVLKICRTNRAAIILISFSNFVFIKHTVLPLTDIPYLMVSLGCCALLELVPGQQRGRKALLFLLALLFMAAAMLVRRVGVALIPAVLYAMLPDGRHLASTSFSRFTGKARLSLIACAGLAILSVAAVASRWILYMPDFRFRGSLREAVVRQMSMRLTDFGELLINAPASKLGRLHPAIFPAGLLLTVLICVGLWRARRELHPTHVYILAYLAVLAIWPFMDARFWIPVLPLITILVFQAIMPSSHPRIANRLAGAYLAFYTVTVLAALAYTTRITFAGPRFPELYGDQSARNCYEHAWTVRNPDPADDFTFAIRRYWR
jgi:hypothetical protein